MSATKIEWCDHTINPVVGCTKCSPGCDNCYAERFAVRLSKNPATAAKYAGVVNERGWTGKMSALDVTVFHPLHAMKKPRRIFCGSMTDLFARGTSFDDLRCIWTQMRAAAKHTFCILTKRPERMYAFCEDNANPPLPNVWLGVTVCNQAEADAKIPILLSIPAVKRFVSVEPMLGPVDFQLEWLTGELAQDSPYLDWVICGGETGHGARPAHPDWFRSLRDQCQGAGVPFFFKGWGEWVTENQSPEDIVLPGNSIVPHGWKGKKYEDSLYKVGKHRAGRLLDGVEYSEFPA
ncbi:MAG: phage Gp37/Gp68 family protein [Desulfovibrio sp.]|jgi:protein gp37|nr:phage Gp37/Gp68 family protein [Desulfovibrio sp.]